MNKYYVYQHVDSDGTIVYVGMGSGARAWRVEGRTPEHKQWMLSKMPSQFKWNIVDEGLTQQEAFALEHKLLLSGDFRFNLYSKSRRPKPPSNESKMKRVVNLDTGEVFDSVNSAASSYGVHGNTISRSCKGEGKAVGYNWKFYDAA